MAKAMQTTTKTTAFFLMCLTKYISD